MHKIFFIAVVQGYSKPPLCAADSTFESWFECAYVFLHPNCHHMHGCSLTRSCVTVPLCNSKATQLQLYQWILSNLSSFSRKFIKNVLNSRLKCTVFTWCTEIFVFLFSDTANVLRSIKQSQLYLNLVLMIIDESTKILFYNCNM